MRLTFSILLHFLALFFAWLGSPLLLIAAGMCSCAAIFLRARIFVRPQ